MTFQENTILNNIERHCEMRDRFRHIGIICLHNQMTVMINPKEKEKNRREADRKTWYLYFGNMMRDICITE